LEPVLRATAETLFRDPRPPGLELELEDSISYPRWLASTSLHTH